MSSSKNIDKICIVILAVTLVVTVLFMNGEKLGIKVIKSESDEMFSAEDEILDISEENATYLSFGNNDLINGNGAYKNGNDINVVYAGIYILSGELNGSVVVDADGDDLIRMIFDGVNITSSDSAAIYVKNAKKVILTLKENTSNSLVMENSSDSVQDGVIYSCDDVTINGKGTLSITGNYKHGIVCNDDLIICGGNIFINAKEDAIHSHDSVKIKDSNITIEAGDDGIHSFDEEKDSYIYIESGNISINSCYEGIESKNITIAGGIIEIYPTDDGINGNDNNSLVKIDGGILKIINESGRDADGIDSNHDIEINGGEVFISVNCDGSDFAVDYGSETGGSFTINGGKVICAGSGSMLEEVSAESKQAFIVKSVDKTNTNSVLALSTDNGDTIFTETIPCSFDAVILSAERIKKGDTVIISIDGKSEKITVDNSSLKTKGRFGEEQNPQNGGFKNNPNMGDKIREGSIFYSSDENTNSFDGRNSEDFPNDMPKNKNGMMPDFENGFGGEIPDRKPGNNQADLPDDMPEKDFENFNRSDIPDDSFLKNDDEKEETKLNFSEKEVILVLISCVILIIGIVIAKKMY